jgi:hypothetical protein
MYWFTAAWNAADAWHCRAVGQDCILHITAILFWNRLLLRRHYGWSSRFATVGRNDSMHIIGRDTHVHSGWYMWRRKWLVL